MEKPPYMSNTQNTIAIAIPEMTMEQYARSVGVSKSTVEKWVDRGYLPSFKLGKYRMVNVVQRTLDCSSDRV